MMNNNSKTITVLGLGLAVGYANINARESLQDVPVSITAFSGLELTESATLRTATLQELTPLIRPSVIQPDAFALRGVSSGGTLEDAANPNLALPDISRVPVLRGPGDVGLYGRDSATGIVGIIGAGHTENATHDPFNEHASGFISAGIGYKGYTDLGYGKLSYGLSAMLTRYDNAFEDRKGDDQYLHDFSLFARYSTELSQSAELDVNLLVNYGDHGTIPRGFNWAGPLQQAVIDYSADATVTWRTDGQDLTSPGLVLRTGLHYGGYDERDGNFADSQRYSLTQELIWLQKADTGLYLRAEIGEREFDEMSDYDSTRINGTVGFFRPLPCGSELRLGVGLEHRDYEGDNLDDYTDLTAEAIIAGDIGQGRFSFGAQYGSFENFVNWGSGNGVNMMGLQIGARVTHPLSDRLAVRFSLESSHLNAASSDSADGTLSFQRGSVSFGYRYDAQTTFDLSGALNRANVDNGTTSRTDIYPTWTISIKRHF